MSFAADWGYAELAMANLFAWRTTDPAELAGVEDPVGPDNDHHLELFADTADLVVAAWGADAAVTSEREAEVLAIVGGCSCLGTTQGDRPRHPLYLPSTLVPEPFATRSAAA